MAHRVEVSSYLPSQSELRTKTVLNVCGVGKSKCGYCKSGEPSSIVYGVSVRQHISCKDYEEAMSRGWRRSGRFIYKPDMQKVDIYVYVVCVGGWGVITFNLPIRGIL